MTSVYSNTIMVDFSNSFDAITLNSELFKGLNDRGWTTFELDTPKDATAWPNACVPIAGIIEHYRKNGIEIKCLWKDNGSFLDKAHVHEPFEAGKDSLLHPLNKVWKFRDSIEIRDLVDSVVDEMLSKDELEKGLLEGITWCLYETMDNALRHSEADRGYFMGVYTPSNKRLSISVFDNGIGIYNSLKTSDHLTPESPLDAITLALRERITRDERIGQGNGMWGLSRIVENNGGSYTVISNGALLSFFDGIQKTIEKNHGVMYPSEKLGTTMVDFQLDCSREIDATTALNGKPPILLWLEDMETVDGDAVQILIANEKVGTGTRSAGETIRNKVLNILRQSRKKIILDFSNVSVVSSSFADELIGKLVAKVGFSRFGNYFSMQGLSQFCQKIIDRSVQQRMAQMYYDEQIKEEE